MVEGGIGLVDERGHDPVELLAVQRNPKVQLVDHDLRLLFVGERDLGPLDGTEDGVGEVAAHHVVEPRELSLRRPRLAHGLSQGLEQLRTTQLVGERPVQETVPEELEWEELLPRAIELRPTNEDTVSELGEDLPAIDAPVDLIATDRDPVRGPEPQLVAARFDHTQIEGSAAEVEGQRDLPCRQRMRAR